MGFIVSSSEDNYVVSLVTPEMIGNHRILFRYRPVNTITGSIGVSRTFFIRPIWRRPRVSWA